LYLIIREIPRLTVSVAATTTTWRRMASFTVMPLSTLLVLTAVTSPALPAPSRQILAQQMIEQIGDIDDTHHLAGLDHRNAADVAFDHDVHDDH